MPTLTVAGHSVTVGDEFLKLSPEEQAATVDHIAQHLPAEKSSQEKPSGIVDGLQHGIAEAARGNASTIGLTGAPTATLDGIAAHAEPKDYHAAHLIREGGHWYNPSDYQPSALPQILAEQAPGLAQDASVGYTAGKLAPGGPTVKALAGMGGFAGSALLRTFGTGAHANADARTGTQNSPVETTDLTREAAKQAVLAPLNMVGASRILPTSKLAGTALTKYLTTVGTEAGVGAAGDVVNQAATTAGSKDGLNVDLNRTAEAAATRAAGSGLLVAPRLATEAAGNAKFSKYEADPETQLAAQALAKRQLGIADGRALVGPLGGTKVAAEAVNGAHADVHNELSAAIKGETLSPDNSNVMSRIKGGGNATPSEVASLATEASPATMHLARQALISKQLRDSGNLTDNSFSGGLSGAMDKLSPINSPIKATAATTAAAIAGHAGLGAGLGAAIGSVAPAGLGALFATYLAAHGIDKMTGSRSPAQAFAERFGGTEAPTRLPGAPAPEGDPFNPSAGPWGARVNDAGPTGPSFEPQTPETPQPSLSKTLKVNASLEEGMGRIAKTLADQKRKSMIADAMPAIKDLAASRQPLTTDEPAPAPEAPNISPIALKMAKAKMALGLPPDPVAPPPAPPTPAPAPVISPIALKMAKAQMAKGLPPEPVAPTPAPPVAPAPPQINPVALTMLKQKLKMGLPPTPVAPPEAQTAPVAAAPVAPAPGSTVAEASTPAPANPEAPAQPSISQLIANMKAKSKAAQAVNPAATPPGGVVAQATPAPAPPAVPIPATPAEPLIAKITKAKGEAMKQTPTAQEHMDPDTGEVLTHTPLTTEQLYGRNMTHEQFALREANDKIASGELKPEKSSDYQAAVIHDRLKREYELQNLSHLEAAPDDTPLAKLLLQELHHTRDQATAESAINFYGSHMSPHMRAASRKLMKGPFHKMWSKEHA